MPRRKGRGTSWSRDDAKRRREAARWRRGQESAEARAARLQNQRFRTNNMRAKETVEERYIHLQKDKNRRRRRREKETEEQRNAHLQDQRQRIRMIRNEETEGERAARHHKDKERHRVKIKMERKDRLENMLQREITQMVLSLRVSELHVLLGFAGWNKRGRKQELSQRALALVQKGCSLPVQDKIRELYRDDHNKNSFSRTKIPRAEDTHD